MQKKGLKFFHYAVDDFNNYFDDHKLGTGLISSTKSSLTFDYLIFLGRNVKNGKINYASTGSISINSETRQKQRYYKVLFKNKMFTEDISSSLVSHGKIEKGLISYELSATKKSPTPEFDKYYDLKTKGVVSGNTLLINDNSGKLTLSLKGPLIADWQLPELAATLKPKKKFHFTLLQNGLYIKPGMTLVYDEEVPVPVKNNFIKMKGYSVTGQGISPLHILVDDKGLPQLMTSLQVNWALKENA